MLENTRQNIIEAAIFTFNEDLSAPLEKVADQAAVTRRTLHRYFKDRKELLDACREEMQKCCQRAMSNAGKASENPVEQLELLLHAAIDCGVKYAFLHKLHHLHDHKHEHHDKDCAAYDKTFDEIGHVVEKLRRSNVISPDLSSQWITAFFPSVVSATIHTHISEKTDKMTLKNFAWYSFSKGIGI